MGWKSKQRDMDFCVYWWIWSRESFVCLIAFSSSFCFRRRCTNRLRCCDWCGIGAAWRCPECSDTVYSAITELNMLIICWQQIAGQGARNEAYKLEIGTLISYSFPFYNVSMEATVARAPIIYDIHLPLIEFNESAGNWILTKHDYRDKAH